MATRRILIIAPEFPPSATVGAKRPSKLAARCGEFGWQPAVVTMAEGDYEITDPSSVTDAIAAVPTHRVPCGSVWIHSERWRQAKPGLPRLWAGAKRWFALKTQRFLPTDKYWPWPKRAAKLAAKLVRRQDIDLIWATSPPLSGPDLAWRIFKRTGVPFVVDYRDVVSQPADGDVPKHVRKFLNRQELILADAAGITTVAPYQIDALKRSHPQVAQTPARLVTNWFEAADAEPGAYPPIEFDWPTVFHAGKLYGGTRRLDGLFEGMGLLRDAMGDPGRRPRFLHLDPEGVNPGLKAIVDEKGLADVVDLQPAASETEFRRHCRGAAVLLLVVGHTQGAFEHARTIPGKLYEYFAACRPILVIGPDDCEAGKMVTDAHRGLAVADDDPQAIAGALTTLMADDAGDRFDLSVEAVSRYEAAGVISQMCSFFDEIVGAG